MSGFQILNMLSDVTGGNVLHGGEVSVELLSEETLKSYFDGKRLCRAEYALNVFGKEQGEVLGKMAELIDSVSCISSFFAFKLCGAKGDYTTGGNYRYTVNFTCKFICEEGEA